MSSKSKKSVKKTAKRTTKRPAPKRHLSRSERLADQAAIKAESVAERRQQPFGRRATDVEAPLAAARALEEAQHELAETVHELKETVVTNAKATRPASLSRTAEELIKAGKTDEEVLAVLVKQHGLDPETKKHYPGWFRARLVRQHAITKTFAQSHRHAQAAS